MLHQHASNELTDNKLYLEIAIQHHNSYQKLLQTDLIKRNKLFKLVRGRQTAI